MILTKKNNDMLWELQEIRNELVEKNLSNFNKKAIAKFEEWKRLHNKKST